MADSVTPYTIPHSAFTWPVAFPPHIGECGPFSLLKLPAHRLFSAVFLVFRWLTGFAGAAFLSVAGGSVSDMFHNHRVAKWVILKPRWNLYLSIV